MYDVCVRTGPYQSLKHIQIERRKCASNYTVFGRLRGHQFDASRREGRKLQENSEHTCDMQFLAISAKERTAVGKEDLLTSRLWVTKGREFDKVVDRKNAWMGQKKSVTASMTSFPLFWGLVLIGPVLHLPTREGKCFFVFNKHKRLRNTQKKLDSSTTARITHWMKSFEQDVSGSSMVTESLKATAFQQDVCQSPQWWTSILYIDYIHYVSRYNNVILDQK